MLDEQDQEVHQSAMIVTYDRQTDILTIRLKTARILESDEEGSLPSFEILDASRRIEDATRVDFKVTV